MEQSGLPAGSAAGLRGRQGRVAPVLCEAGAGLNETRLMLFRPRHDRHRADRVRWRALDDLRAHPEIDVDIPLRIGDSANACLLEKDAGLLAEGLLPLWQLRDVGCNRSGLTAVN